MVDTQKDIIFENNLRERMASLEASNAFHREALSEISSSLKEVVKTQHILATQKEEIVKLVSTVNDTQREVRGVISDNATLKFRLDSLTEKQKTLAGDVNRIELDLDEIAMKVRTNTSFVSSVVKIGVAVISPLIVALVLKIAEVI